MKNKIIVFTTIINIAIAPAAFAAVDTSMYFPNAAPTYQAPAPVYNPPVQYQQRPVDNSRSIFEASQNRAPAPAPIPPNMAPRYRSGNQSMYNNNGVTSQYNTRW